MRFWTFKTPQQVEVLKKEGKLWGCPKAITNEWEDFVMPYDWMRVQMKEKLSDFSGKYPIWAWGEKPDLRRQEFFSDTDHYLIEFETSREFLASNFSLWHFPLNRMYLSVSDEDEQKHEAHIIEKYQKRVGFDNYQADDQVKVIQSWKTIFDFEFLEKNADFFQYHKDEKKQYCLDGIFLPEVISMRFIKGRHKHE